MGVKFNKLNVHLTLILALTGSRGRHSTPEPGNEFAFQFHRGGFF